MHILITGASSGLGKALALTYAAPGVTLYLCGRNKERLASLASSCQQRGAATEWCSLDITHAESLHTWLQSFTVSFDLVFANAGVSGGTAGAENFAKETYHIFDVNLSGVLHTIFAILPQMQTAQKGQIVIISSIAGLRGMPGCPAYAASKAAVKAWGEGLRGYLAAWNIGVTVVLPGYIKTPMTAVNTFPMPFLMTAEKAATLIKTHLPSNPPRIAFPRLFYYVCYLLSCLSPRLTDWLYRRLPAKRSLNE